MAATTECPKSPRSPPLRKAKILMLHGHAESGPKFHAKTRPLAEHLRNTFPPAPLPGFLPEFPGGAELFYPTAPLRLTGVDIHTSSIREADYVSSPKDLDAFAWGSGDVRNAEEIEGLGQSVAMILEFIQAHGPFIGVIGFSCGATVSAILASLLEGNRRVEGWRTNIFGHPPLRFAVCYNGFQLTSPDYKPCYYPKIRTPILHVIGSFDPVIGESQTLGLARRCSNGRVLEHPGGHYAPMKNFFVHAVTEFIDGKVGRRGELDDSSDSDWEDI